MDTHNNKKSTSLDHVFSTHTLELIDTGVVLINAENKVVLWNHWMAESSGISTEIALNQELHLIFKNKIKGRLLQAVEQALRMRLSSLLSCSLNRHVLPLYKVDFKNEGRVPIAQSITVKPLLDEQENGYCLIQINDVTEVMNREALLKKIGGDLKTLAHDKAVSEAKVRSIIENTVDSIITFDSRGLIKSYNPAAKDLFQLALLAKKELYLQDIIEALQSYQDQDIQNIIESLGYTHCDAESRWPEAQGLRPNSSNVPLEMTVSKISVEDECLFTAVIRDISERKESEERLIKLAQFDTLTGLANRSLFSSRLNYVISRARRSEKICALFLLDLDHFKSINDSLGHGIGDGLLQHVASQIKHSIRDVDLGARIGGDEFAIILDECGSQEEAARVANRINELISTPLKIAGRELQTSASIGITTFDHRCENAGSLIKCADTALYYAKDQGRNNFQFYTPQLRKLTEVRSDLEGSLHKALTNNEFSLDYQAQIDIKRGCIAGIEALLRWEHPKLGFVSPANFIPLLEETGLIAQVGAWVLETACHQHAAWLQQGILDPACSIAINFSAKQIKNHETAELIRDILKKTGLDSALLDVELTEGTLMESYRNPTEVLDELKALGVKISIDDFGTGYSSLSYLKQFPIDNLKIDRAFITDLHKSKDSAAIVNTIIQLGNNLGLTVIAEGVENQDEYDHLDELGCHWIQGYFLGLPMSAEAFETFALKWSQKKIAKADSAQVSLSAKFKPKA